jgi:diphthamide biosynthesis protein 3
MKLDISATIYKPETVAALSRYRQHLRDTREQLKERQASALEELKAYEEVDCEALNRGGSRGRSESAPMKEIARRYGALIHDIEDVRLEMERLNL